jgi:DNA-binding transcriptional regulator YbjK
MTRDEKIQAVIDNMIAGEIRPSVERIIEAMHDSYGHAASTRDIRPVLTSWREKQHKTVDRMVKRVAQELNIEQRSEFQMRIKAGM